MKTSAWFILFLLVGIAYFMVGPADLTGAVTTQINNAKDYIAGSDLPEAAQNFKQEQMEMIYNGKEVTCDLNSAGLDNCYIEGFSVEDYVANHPELTEKYQKLQNLPEYQRALKLLE